MRLIPDYAFGRTFTALVAVLLIHGPAEASGITDDASAIAAAKRYLKARCTAETPCRFKPEHEGKQWRVWVQLTRKHAANEAPRPYPGGTVILYFDAKGNLTRRLEAE